MSIFERIPQGKREEVINILAEALYQRVKPIIEEKMRRAKIERANKKDM